MDERHGRLDVVVNCAGIMRFARIEELTVDEWQRHLAVNLTGPFLVSQAAVPHLVETKGSIVSVASIAGVKGQAYTSAYCASKGGVVLFTKSLALELASRGVRVNCVCPGGVETPLIMGAIESMPADAERKLMARLDSVLPGLVHPDEVAEAITYLASDAARMITGTTLLLDGGTRADPRSFLRRQWLSQQPVYDAESPPGRRADQSGGLPRARGWRPAPRR